MVTPYSARTPTPFVGLQYCGASRLHLAALWSARPPTDAVRAGHNHKGRSEEDEAWVGQREQPVDFAPYSAIMQMLL